MKWQAFLLEKFFHGVPLVLLAVFATSGWKTVWPEIVDAAKVRGLWQEEPRPACYWNSTVHETERVLAPLAGQPGTVAFFNWRGRAALPARQDRMAAGYFLCPRPLPEALGQAPGTPDWIFTNSAIAHSMEEEGWARFYDAVVVDRDSTWLYRKRKEPRGENEEEDP